MLCVKRKYRNQNSALISASEQWVKNGRVLRAYKCSNCKNWHLTSQWTKTNQWVKRYK